MAGSDLPETQANDPRGCGSSDEVTPRTDKDTRRRSGPGDLARRDRNPAHPADRLHNWGQADESSYWQITVTDDTATWQTKLSQFELPASTRAMPDSFRVGGNHRGRALCSK
jgi:hypothetical protein